MNKKGALELGINTVVILVIAIILIGGGIAFITNIGNKLTENVDNIPDELLPVKPTSSEPLALSAEEVSIKKGGSEQLTVGVYNTGSTPADDVIITSDSCTGENSGKLTIQSIPTTIESGATAGYKVILKTTDSIDEGVIICNIKAVDKDDHIVAEDQITLNIFN